MFHLEVSSRAAIFCHENTFKQARKAQVSSADGAEAMMGVREKFKGGRGTSSRRLLLAKQ